MILRCILLLLVLAAAPASAQRRLVPEQYPTIQAAIVAAVPGDTVLVAAGRYVENLDFMGKDVVVASHFALDRDPAHIAETVIDGSQPANPDTASVVRFIHGETRAAVLEGFTLTGGTGTRWIDEAGFGVYQEGGGIIVAFSSPTIRYNRLVANEAVRRCGGCTSAGGGAIRAGNGAPLIEHNVIADNVAMYGGGVVLNYTSAVLRNNVVVRNRVVQAAAGAPTFGGGGLWVNGIGPNGSTPNLIENNTVAGNAVESAAGGTPYSGRGGGVLFLQGALTFRNNVVWGNTQVEGPAFANLGGTLNARYNDVEGGVPGNTGNIDVDPVLTAGTYHLGASSPAVDAGEPAAAFNDPQDPARPGMALFPALGTTRADMGAYGGPGASGLVALPTASEPLPSPGGKAALPHVYPNPAAGAVTLEVQAPAGQVQLVVYDLVGRRVRTLAGPSHSGGPLRVRWDGRDEAGSPVPPGTYFLRLRAPVDRTARVVVAR